MFLQPTSNHLWVAFVALPIHTNYLHANTYDMMILYFYHNRSHIYYYRLHIEKWHDIFPL